MSFCEIISLSIRFFFEDVAKPNHRPLHLVVRSKETFVRARCSFRARGTGIDLAQ